MLNAALRVENRIHQAHDRTCVSTGRSPETSGPSSPECTEPPKRFADRRGATPARRCPFVHGLRPAGVTAMVSSSLLNPASDAVYVGRVRGKRTANGRAVCAGPAQGT